jgi:hypothetical protein
MLAGKAIPDAPTNLKMKSKLPLLEGPYQRAAKFCWLVIAVGVVLCQSAPAAYYLQDGFNYPSGTLGTNPPWASPTSLISVVDGGLSYTNLADLSIPGGAVSVAQNSSPSAAITYRPFDTTATGGSVYFSFLIEFTNVNASSYIAGLLPSTVGLPGGTASDPCDLYVRSATGGYNLGVAAKNGATAYESAPLALNTVYFVVLKYDLTASRASLYLKPSPGGSEPASPDATSTGLTVTSLTHLFLRVTGASAGNFIMDTVRVGSTWADVTPLGQVAPATRLVFTATPTTGTAGTPMTNIIMQIQNDSAFNVPSNNVPITMTLNTGTFAGGTTTVNSDAYGRATFNDLAVALPGNYTLTATASGIGTGLAGATSGSIVVGATNIAPAGYALSAFLDSLQVEQYWTNGLRVNWLTGAAGGSGTNMTTGTASHCSAFAAAVADLLGIYLLRQPDASDLNLANNQADWLRTNTAAGWYAVSSMTDAQHLANIGTLVVASYKETDGSSGHIAILRPSTKSDTDILAAGPQECQSGINNYNNTDVRTGFAQHDNPLDNILYYGHAVTNAITPVNPTLSPCCLSNGVVRAFVTSIVGRTYKFQCTSNFGAWTDVLTYTNSNASADFFCVTPLIDSSLAGAPRRFYRLFAR